MIRLKKINKIIVLMVLAVTIMCVGFNRYNYIFDIEHDLDLVRRNIEVSIQMSLKDYKGAGCVMPKLDPFSNETMQFVGNSSLVCSGHDWVKCYLHECRVTDNILTTTKDIKCIYRDIILINDFKYTLGPPKAVYGKEPYVLESSDHVKIVCAGLRENDLHRSKWMGYGAGFRTSSARAPLAGNEGIVDVLIFGFDSTSKNGFIRKMPKSYKFITEHLGATVLNSYNIVGDGTRAALFPILTGKTELEMPDLRKVMSTETLDELPFIFFKLKKLGYRTAFFEDRPDIGTFQLYFNGFKRQPTDHYLRAFFLEEAQVSQTRYTKQTDAWFCVGDTPRHQLMMNITEQFFKLAGGHFAFTFISDISHTNFDMISTADDATVCFLRSLLDAGHLEHTVLFVMGDHGLRYDWIRNTLQGKLEERLPLMAIRLPHALTDKRPDILGNLVANVDVLTTPHDIHATILDALDMEEHMNPYRVPGADLKRALTLFRPENMFVQIPHNRSCGEAGIEPHWCACYSWQTVSPAEPIHRRAADAFLAFINSLTEPVRSLCAPRTLISISWVTRRTNGRLLAFKESRDNDGYVGRFNENYNATGTNDNYQVKVVVGPGQAVFEASATYFRKEDEFEFDVKDVSRINAYNDEPSCIIDTHPHLSKYCYCK